MAAKIYNGGVSWLIEKKKNNGLRFSNESPSSVAGEADKGTTYAKDVLRQLNKTKEMKEVGYFMPRWWGWSSQLGKLVVGCALVQATFGRK